jgi:hypothetical protein
LIIRNLRVVVVVPRREVLTRGNRRVGAARVAEAGAIGDKEIEKKGEMALEASLVEALAVPIEALVVSMMFHPRCGRNSGMVRRMRPESRSRW